MASPRALWLTGDPDADAQLSRDPLALLLGMLFDQQFPMERAFAAPRGIALRLGLPDGEPLDAAALATAEPEAFAALVAGPPALHRFPSSMAGRVQAVCAHLVEHYDGAAQRLWEGDDGPLDAEEILRRVRALPGFGEQKARIFLALLAKQWGVAAPGWEHVAGRYGEPGVHRSIADVTSADTLARVRADKQQQKAAART